MRFLPGGFWRRIFRRAREDLFDQQEVPEQIELEMMHRMYKKYPHYSWSDIQELFPSEIARERARVHTEFRRYIFPIRFILRVLTRIFPSISI